MKYIEKLTPEQEARMPEWRDKWVEIGLKTGETDWETFDKYMPICYQKAGLEYPKRVVRVSSPLVGALAASVAHKIWEKRSHASVDASVGESVGESVGASVGASVDESVGESVGASVRESVGESVGESVDESVHASVRASVDESVRASVRESVRASVDESVHASVGESVGESVGASVGASVDESVHASVDASVDESVGEITTNALRERNNLAKEFGVAPAWNYWLGGQFWVGGWYWGSAYVSYFIEVCGLKLGKDIMERYEVYRKINESVNYIWANKHFVMVCARPIRISRNDRGQLHNTKLKAIEYPDGWGLYMLNGVRFPEDLFKKVTSENVSAKDILSIVDVDQRTQAMRFLPVEDMVKELEGKILDECNKVAVNGENVNYKLYRFPKGKVFTEDAYYMLFDCPSTRKKHMEGVEKATTVPEAMAWAEDITKEDWCARIPLLHEV